MLYKALGLFLLIAFLFGCWCAARFSVNLCPDEEGRILLSNWIFQKGTLPTGYEYELIDPDPFLDPYHDYSSPNWGYDYAFTPYLPSMLGGLAMKAASLVTQDPKMLLFAARCVDLAGYAVLCFYAFRLAKECLTTCRGAFVLLICGLPQVQFLAGYLNNDLFSLMSSVMIFYYLMRGKRTGWDTASCMGLGVSVSVSLLTYYFGYGLILAGALYALADCVSAAKRVGGSRREQILYVLKRAGIVAGIVLLLAGWYFIRNLIIYDGDLFGIASQHRCAELYEQAGHEVYDPPTIYDRGATWKYFFDITMKSAVGIFGYMDILMPDGVYLLFDGLFLTGLLLYLPLLTQRLKNRQGRRSHLCLLFAVFAPVCFSIYRSATYDFEPQGRYLISALPAVAYLTASGYGWLEKKAQGENGRTFDADCFLCPLLIALWLYAAVRYLIPLASA